MITINEDDKQFIKERLIKIRNLCNGFAFLKNVDYLIEEIETRLCIFEDGQK